MRIPTYLDVLKEAELLRKSKEKPDLERAEQILRQGMIDHPYALPLGDELVLVLELLNRDAEALRLLEELRQRHQDAGEETLCRFGKIYKKRADRLLASGGLAAAYPSLGEAERYYGLAYEKSFGFYPRINELTVRFLRASAAASLDRPDEADKLLRSVRHDAATMLTDPNLWQPRKADDHVWIPATQGEANFLLGHWSDAEDRYREAMREAAAGKFYFDCMRDQVKMLMVACSRLRIVPTGKLADPDAFFTPPPTKKAAELINH